MTETGFTEDCCWTEIRQFCLGKNCACECHTVYPEPPNWKARTEKAEAELAAARAQAEASRADQFRRAANARAQGDALAREVEALRAALRPFVAATHSTDGGRTWLLILDMADIERARAAVAGAVSEPDTVHESLEAVSDVSIHAQMVQANNELVAEIDGALSAAGVPPPDELAETGSGERE